MPPRLEFGPELPEYVLAGEITVSFSLWRRPEVRVEGRYSVRPGQIKFDSMLFPVITIRTSEMC